MEDFILTEYNEKLAEIQIAQTFSTGSVGVEQPELETPVPQIPQVSQPTAPEVNLNASTGGTVTPISGLGTY